MLLSVYIYIASPILFIFETGPVANTLSGRRVARSRRYGARPLSPRRDLRKLPEKSIMRHPFWLYLKLSIFETGPAANTLSEEL